MGRALFSRDFWSFWHLTEWLEWVKSDCLIRYNIISFESIEIFVIFFIICRELYNIIRCVVRQWGNALLSEKWLEPRMPLQPYILCPLTYIILCHNKILRTVVYQSRADKCRNTYIRLSRATLQLSACSVFFFFAIKIVSAFRVGRVSIRLLHCKSQQYCILYSRKWVTTNTVHPNTSNIIVQRC